MDSESVRSGRDRVPQIEDEVSSSSDVDSQSARKRQICDATAWYALQSSRKEPLPSCNSFSGRSAIAGEVQFSKAMNQGDIALAKTLIEDGVDVKQISMAGRSPLSFAVLKRDAKMVKLLLGAGMNPNEQECDTIGGVLAWACYRGDLETARLLIDAGSDVNLQLRAGSFGNALAAACGGWSVEYLLEVGADINMQLTSGEYGSALAAACTAGSLWTIAPMAPWFFGSLVNSRSVEQASVPLAFLPGNPACGDIRVFPPPQMSDV